MLRRTATIRALAVAAACAALAGCSSANRSGPAQSSSGAAANATFATMVEQRGLAGHGSPAALRDLAGTICTAYARGHSRQDVVTDLVNGGWSAADAGALSDVAVAAYCPQESGPAHSSSAG